MTTAKQERDGKGCLGRCEDDEPVFVLRAKDQVASLAVRHWVDRAAAVGVSARKLDAAMCSAEAMEEWRLTHGGGKVPD